MHESIRNSVGLLTDDSFTQTNPPVVTTAGTISTQVDTTRLGVLGGSICFSRPDAGPNFIGGNVESLADPSLETFLKPLGLFINASNGNAFENLPGQASGKGPYVSSQGTHANGLFETQVLDGAGIAGFSTGDAIPYVTGVELIASRNAYLMPREAIDGTSTVQSMDVAGHAAQVEHGSTASDRIAILKVPADASLNELVYDQRI
jgi:hypothetical protein